MSQLGRYGQLTAALVVLAAMYPLLDLGYVGYLVWSIWMWIVMLSTISACAQRPRTRTLASSLLVATIGLGVTGMVLSPDPEPDTWYVLGIRLSRFLCLVLTTAVIVMDVLRGSRVTLQTILAAACVYVLIGLTFSQVFLVLESVSGQPQLAFTPNDVPPPETHLALTLYFSFVTLTTLGYGDVVPQTETARVLATSLSIAGQLYMTILVARLVGLHISQQGQIER